MASNEFASDNGTTSHIEYVAPSYLNSDFDWSLKKDKKGIQIYTAKVKGSSFLAVLSIVSVKASPKNLAELVMNLKKCPKWAAMCKYANLHKKISDTEMLVYSLNDAPFPVRDRDVVANVKWFLDRPSQKISMLSYAIDSDVPLKKGVIRVHNAVSEWHFTPQENGTTLVENFAHIDPNGAIPAWLVNALVIDAPYKTLKRLRRQVEADKNRDS